MLSGTTSVISGGSFFEGAVVGLIVHMCNRGMHGEKEPSRIDWNASGDEVYRGLSEWIDYLDDGSYKLKKTSSGKHYSIFDVFENLPSKPDSYGIAGSGIHKAYALSNGDHFSVSLFRYSIGTSSLSNITLLETLGYKIGDYSKGKYLELNFMNKYKDSMKGISDSVFKIKLYGEQLYSPVLNNIFSKLK